MLKSLFVTQNRERIPPLLGEPSATQSADEADEADGAPDNASHHSRAQPTSRHQRSLRYFGRGGWHAAGGGAKRKPEEYSRTVGSTAAAT